MDVSLIFILLIHGIRVFPFIVYYWFIICTYEFGANKSRHSSRETSDIFNSYGFSLNMLNNTVFYCLILCVLLILSGIETNPGPSSSNDSYSSVNSSDSGSVLFEQFTSFVHVNIQSLVPKLDLVLTEFSTHDILSFSESWLGRHVDDNLLRLPGYKFPPFRRDRPDRQGGGVIVYVKDHINCKLRPDLNVGDIECVWIELTFRNKKTLYGTFYIPPNSPPRTWDELDESVDIAISTNCEVILTGDFNINQLSNNVASDRISSLKSRFSLHQLITSPTYFTEHSSSLLDLILVSNPRSVLHSEVGAPLLNQVRYHLPVIGTIDQPSRQTQTFKRKIFLYDRGDYDSFRRQLNAVDWDAMFVTRDVDTITEFITNTISDIADKNIPNKVISVRKDNPPWFTTKLKSVIRKKNRLHKKAKRTNLPSDWQKFRSFRNRCNKLVLNAKDDYYKNISDKILSESCNSKNYWTLVKSLMNLDSFDGHAIPPIQVGDDIISDLKQKAGVFNDYFCSQSDLNDSDKPLPNIPNRRTIGLSNIVITEKEVEDILKILDTTKATGPDLLNPRLLKEACNILKYPLCKLFNLSLETGIFPSNWKIANVTPVFKKDSPSDYKNYRPISLISVLGKVMERCIYKHIHNYLVEHSIISSHQSGFTPGDSAINQLINITNEFGKALDQGKEIRVIFCDISKAFDRVWHKGLLRKLESIGINGTLLAWVTDYLSNRKQRVVINGCSSDWRGIRAGVPQGSILGPLLFIIFINDIVYSIRSTIKLFADDTSLFLVVDDPAESAAILNSDLHKIHTWSKDWLVTFNPQKTETVTISRKVRKPPHPSLLMDDSVILETPDHKHLGLLISNDGTWSKHIDMIINKSFKRINILRKFKFILDRRTLEKIYLTFIRPILEYADVIWDNTTVHLVNKIESVQIEAARIVTGGTRLVSFEKLYCETGWEKLKDRRETHRLTYFYKMTQQLAPQYLIDMVPRNLGNIHDHNTRNVSIIPPIRTNTALYSNYFLPATVRSWNLLPSSVKTSPSISAFKNSFHDRDIKKPIYFYAGKRLGQILHARLRMQCSLNLHLFVKNIIDSPNCQCGAIESTTHYLFHCARFTRVRQQYLHFINPTYTEEILLNGSEYLSDDQNEQLFLAVQAYILSSRRFEN